MTRDTIHPGRGTHSALGRLARMAGTLGFLGLLAAIVAFAPEPLATRLIEADGRDSAATYQARLLRQLSAGARPSPPAAFPPPTWPSSRP